MKLSELQYNALGSFYLLPTIICVVVAGVVVDRYGYRLCSLVFAFLCFIGQTFVSLGVLYNSYPLLVVGKLIFGIGSESLQLSTMAYLFTWFRGFMLNFSFGVRMATGKTAAFLNIYFSESFYRYLIQGAPAMSNFSAMFGVLAIGLAYTFVAVLLCLALAALDNRYTRLKTNANESPSNISVMNFLKDFRNYPLTFWILCLFCFTFYLSFDSYASVSPLYIILKYDFSTKKANAILSLSPLLSIVLSLFIGFLVGKIGREIVWFWVSCILCLVAHTTYSLTFIHPIFIVVSRTLGQSFVDCTIWTTLDYLVPPETRMFSYGLMQSTQNLGQTIFPLLLAYLLDFYGYFALEVVLQWIFSLSLVLTSLLLLIDKATSNGVLFRTERYKHQAAVFLYEELHLEPLET